MEPAPPHRIITDHGSLEADNMAMEIAKRLKCGLDPNNVTLLKETKDGIKVYYPSDIRGTFGAEGLPIARIAVTEINASVAKISEVWMDQVNRKEWDKTIKESQTHTVPGTQQKFHYILRKPVSYFAPGRNFVFQIVKKPGAVLGIIDYNVVTFITVDSSALLPGSWSSVRGSVNSVLMLQPIGLNRTKVTYLVEYAPGGWFWLPSIASFIAGDNVLGSLSSLKASLEYDEMAEFAELSIDEAARRKFSNDRIRANNRVNGTSVIDDVLAQREDIVNTIKLLEKKLTEVKVMENKDGLDLSELKTRISTDLNKAKTRLHGMK